MQPKIYHGDICFQKPLGTENYFTKRRLEYIVLQNDGPQIQVPVHIVLLLLNSVYP
jgi:hypothetical protein